VRVCFLIDRLAAAGTESQLVALIRHLDRQRVEPVLCLLDGSDAVSRSLEPAGCPVLRLGIRSLLRPRTALQCWRLASFLRRERIDVLQLYFPDSTYFGVVAGRLAGVPWIIRGRFNSGHDLTPWTRTFNRLCHRFVQRTVANCEAARRSLLADEGRTAEPIVVLNNGVDLSYYLTIPPLSPDRPGVRRIGMVANLRPVKGLEVFIDAAAKLGPEHGQLEFVVAGEGELRPMLEDMIQERGLAGRFHLVGSVRDIPGFLAGLDVAVLSSHAEGMSNAVLEYVAAARPVVATDVGANNELIEDGVSGLLVPPGDANRMALALSRLLSDRDLAVRLGTAGRRRARERYSREAMVQRYEDFYQSLAGTPPAAMRSAR
jgi:glycosyltransferase involved in cell wall biosynthesis